MDLVIIFVGIAAFAIIVAFIYEIKHTYRDGDFWKD